MNYFKGIFAKVKAGFSKLATFLMLTLVFQPMAYSATGESVSDATFEEIVNLFTGYLEGYFGLAISLASVIIGAVAALYTKTLMFLGFGFGLAVGIVYIPEVLESFFTAAL